MYDKIYINDDGQSLCVILRNCLWVWIENLIDDEADWEFETGKGQWYKIPINLTNQSKLDKKSQTLCCSQFNIDSKMAENVVFYCQKLSKNEAHSWQIAFVSNAYKKLNQKNKWQSSQTSSEQQEQLISNDNKLFITVYSIDNSDEHYKVNYFRSQYYIQLGKNDMKMLHTQIVNNNSENPQLHINALLWDTDHSLLTLLFNRHVLWVQLKIDDIVDKNSIMTLNPYEKKPGTPTITVTNENELKTDMGLEKMSSAQRQLHFMSNMEYSDNVPDDENLNDMIFLLDGLILLCLSTKGNLFAFERIGDQIRFLTLIRNDPTVGENQQMEAKRSSLLDLPSFSRAGSSANESEDTSADMDRIKDNFGLIHWHRFGKNVSPVM